MVTATAQRAPDQQRQQAEDTGQHHDDARNACIQAMGERRRDSEPQDRPGRDQNDAGDGADQPPAVYRHDETVIAHRRMVLRPAVLVRPMTRRQNSGLATPIMKSRGPRPSARPGMGPAILPMTDSSISDELTRV
jgi:hypothetical protein